MILINLFFALSCWLVADKISAAGDQWGFWWWLNMIASATNFAVVLATFL
jgi:hypothetical protein